MISESLAESTIIGQLYKIRVNTRDFLKTFLILGILKKIASFEDFSQTFHILTLAITMPIIRPDVSSIELKPFF